MEANGSGATDSPEDPKSLKLMSLGKDSVKSFRKAPFDRLPYLPIPLVKVIGKWQYKAPAEYNQISNEIVEAVIRMRDPLDLEAASLLNLLASHRGSYDGKKAIEICQRARAHLGRTILDTSLRIGLLLTEASVRSQDKNWKLPKNQALGYDLVVQALVLLNRNPKLQSNDFRQHFKNASAQLGFRKNWITKQGQWNSIANSEAWQAEAVIELLKMKRPKDTQ